MNQLQLNPTLPGKNNRSLLQISSPYTKTWNHRDLFNVWCKVKRLADEYRATGTPKSKEVFLQQFVDKKYQDFFNAVKDDSNLNDQATLYAKDVLEHTLTEGDLNNKFTEDINCTTK